MLSIAKMTAESEEYFLRLVRYYLGSRRRKKKNIRKTDGDNPFDDGSDDPDDPDLDADEPFSIDTPGEPPGRWFGKGAAHFGLSGIVEEEPYRRLFKGLHPVTEEPLVQNAGMPDRVPCWDLCFSAPKPVSVLWSQSSPDFRAVIERIHESSVDASLHILERDCAFSRVGKASEGCSYVPVGLVIPIFQHGSSRAKDPNLHSHANVINLGVDEKGEKTRAIHSPPIFRAKMLAGAFYRAKLAAGLRAELGLIAEQEGRSFGIEGVPRSLVRTYSKRRKQILKLLKELGESGAVAASEAAMKTRAKKDFLISRKELIDGWRITNQDAGFDDACVAEMLRHGPRKAAGSYKQALLEALAELTFQKNHFTKQEFLMQTLWKLPVFGLDPDSIFDEVDAFLEKNKHIVPLGEIEGEERFTTREVLEEEMQMWTALERLGKRRGLQASEKNLKKQLRQRPTIRKEQAAFVEHLTQSDSAFRLGLGLAGTGKAYALKTFVDAMKQHGYRILGAAPTGQAADVLSREAGIECQTLTRLLGDFRLPLSAVLSHHARQLWNAARHKRTRRFRQPAPVEITPNTLVLVDEAGMIGTFAMRKIAELVERGGGTLCMIGDPAQLPAIGSSSPLQALARRYGAPVLNEIGRQKQAWAKDAAHVQQGEGCRSLEYVCGK